MKTCHHLAASSNSLWKMTTSARLWMSRYKTLPLKFSRRWRLIWRLTTKTQEWLSRGSRRKTTSPRIRDRTRLQVCWRTLRSSARTTSQRLRMWITMRMSKRPQLRMWPTLRISTIIPFRINTSDWTSTWIWTWMCNRLHHQRINSSRPCLQSSNHSSPRPCSNSKTCSLCNRCKSPNCRGSTKTLARASWISLNLALMGIRTEQMITEAISESLWDITVECNSHFKPNIIHHTVMATTISRYPAWVGWTILKAFSGNLEVAALRLNMTNLEECKEHNKSNIQINQ